MADNPFIVKGDEWGFCRVHKTRCLNAWTDGTCMRGECNQYITNKEENNGNHIRDGKGN